MARQMAGGLRRLSELEDYDVATGYPDIRGWELQDRQGRDLGSVTDLLIDTSRGEPVSVLIHRKDSNWFLELFRENENARLPLSAIDLDEASQVVRVTEPIEQILGGRIDRDANRGERPGTSAVAGSKGGALQAEETLDLVEERLEVDKARRKAGEVRVGKTVETDTVRREVPVEREEVVVERETLDRPIPASEASGVLGGRPDEIIVPIYREEVETTTRAVIAERLRIRKRSVEDTREVSADVRRERPVVEGADVEGGGAPAEGPPDPARRRRA